METKQPEDIWDQYYTFGNGEEVEKNTFRLDPAITPLEDPPGLTIHYSSKEEATSLFSNFASVKLGFEDFSFDSLNHVRAHWIAVAQK